MVTADVNRLLHRVSPQNVSQIGAACSVAVKLLDLELRRSVVRLPGAATDENRTAVWPLSKAP